MKSNRILLNFSKKPIQIYEKLCIVNFNTSYEDKFIYV